jgi:hypothetical protein
MVRTETIMVYPSCYSYILFDSIRKAHNISVSVIGNLSQIGTRYLAKRTHRCTSRFSKYGWNKRHLTLYYKFVAAYRLSMYVPPSKRQICGSYAHVLLFPNGLKSKRSALRSHIHVCFIRFSKLTAIMRVLKFVRRCG